MKPGKALLSMIAGFAAGALLSSLFTTKKRPKITDKTQKKKSQVKIGHAEKLLILTWVNDCGIINQFILQSFRVYLLTYLSF